MKLTTKTSSLDFKQIKKIVNMSVGWCQENMGVNNRRRTKFCVSVCKDRRKKNKLMGVFDHRVNKVVVYYNNCTNVRQLIETTIHEYTHYLQPISKYYFKLYEIYGHSEHPMEKEAFESEKQYKNCWKSLKINYI